MWCHCSVLEEAAEHFVNLFQDTLTSHKSCSTRWWHVFELHKILLTLPVPTVSSSIPGVRALVGDTVVVLVSSLGGGFGSAAHCDTTSRQHPLVWTLSFVISVTTESQRTFSRTNGKSQPVCSRSNLPQGGDKEPLLTLHTHTQADLTGVHYFGDHWRRVLQAREEKDTPDGFII